MGSTEKLKHCVCLLLGGRGAFFEKPGLSSRLAQLLHAHVSAAARQRTNGHKDCQQSHGPAQRGKEAVAGFDQQPSRSFLLLVGNQLW